MKSTFLCIFLVAVVTLEIAIGASTQKRTPFEPFFKRIIAGEETQPNEFPFVVDILGDYSRTNTYLHACPGSLIGAEWVLTPAGCLVMFLDTPKQIRLGEHDHDAVSGRETNHEIVEIHVRDDYFTDRYALNIALVKISPPANLSSLYVQTVGLPNQDAEVPVGQNCTMLGWGLTEEPAQGLSPVLRYVEVPIVSHETCAAVNDQIPYANVSEVFNICAGDPANSKSGCLGDIGGPLVCKNTDDNWVLQGLISWGDINCGQGYYTVCIRISSFVDWIEKEKKKKPLRKPSGCIDTQSYCSKWKNMGYCNWMVLAREYYCKKTCGTCGRVKKPKIKNDTKAN